MKPKLFSAMKSYNYKTFIKDVKAGLIVAIISLPMSMAFAISSGLGPEQGVYTAIIGGILVGLLGGSRVQIAGPTGAFLVIIQMTIAVYGITGLLISTMMAGLMLIVLGLIGVGKLIQYIPRSITLGFTRGIAVIIFTSQIPDFFGLQIQNPQIRFFNKWGVYMEAANTMSPMVVIIAMISLGFMFLWPKINKKIPNSFIVLVSISILVWLLNIDVPILGEIKQFPTKPVIDAVNIKLIINLLKPTFTIALLIALQALLSAAVTDDLIKDKHDSNAELVAQGVANMVCGFVGCMPSTGGVARSIANVKNGARTPIAAISNAIVLLIFMLFLLPIIKHIPKAVLAAIIIYITYNMFNFNELFQSIKESKVVFLIMLSTLILTVTVSLVTAIFVGMLLQGAVTLFKKTASDTN